MTTPRRSRPITTWVLLLAGPVVGITYFLAVYLLAEASCSTDIALLDVSALRAVIIAAGAGALAVFAGSARRARHLWSDAGDPASRGDHNDRFMITTGLMLLGLFALFVLFLAAPAIGTTLC